MNIKFEAQKITINKEVLKNERFVKVAEQEINNTIARTGQLWTNGKMPDGSPIKGKYSEKYKEWKKEKTNRGDTVDLILSNDLRKSFQSQRSKGIESGAEGYFLGNGAEIANSLEARGFSIPIGFGPSDEKRIEKRFADEIEKALDEAIKIS